MINIISLSIFAVALAVGQVLFKKVGLELRGLPFRSCVSVIAREPAFYIALAIYGATTLLWIWILSRVPLSRAYPWVTVTMAIVACFGSIFYGEHLSPILWVGIALISIGVFVIAAIG